MKEKGIQGYKCAVGRSQRDPDKVVRIEIAHEGNTTLLAARLEYCHGGSPVVSGQLLQWPMYSRQLYSFGQHSNKRVC